MATTTTHLHRFNEFLYIHVPGVVSHPDCERKRAAGLSTGVGGCESVAAGVSGQGCRDAEAGSVAILRQFETAGVLNGAAIFAPRNCVMKKKKYISDMVIYCFMQWSSSTS